MKNYKLFILEDDERYVKSLIRYLKDYDSIIDLKSLKIVDNFNEARRLIIAGEKFDISILDYVLDGKTCLDLIAETKNHLSNYGQIVFTTSDPVQNKNFHQFKFLLQNYMILEKPFDETEVARFISEVQIRLNQTYHTEWVVLNLGSNGEERVTVDDIYFIEGAKQYCNYYVMKQGSIKPIQNVSGTLEAQERLLQNHNKFLRVHKSYIVNTDKVKYGEKEGTTGGWLSFDESRKKPNEATPRYTTDHKNYEELKKRIGYKKI